MAMDEWKRTFAATMATAATDAKDQPCEPPVNLRSSDLCAQWKAADAARDGANWTLAALIFGTIINLVTLVFVRLSFSETQKAVQEGRRSADAAVDAVETARKQLEADRAWIIPETPKISYQGLLHFEGEMFGNNFTVEFPIRNFGPTPALQVIVKTGYKISNKMPEFPATFYDEKHVAVAKDATFKALIGICDDDGNRVFHGKGRCFLFLDIEYSDVFSDGNRRSFKAIYELQCNVDGTEDDDVTCFINIAAEPKIV
ncbi:MAG: hypothetical protein WBQ60_10495 [Asticcacaulis sp.]